MSGTWSRRLGTGRPALLHAGRGVRWGWHEGSPWVDDGVRVWWLGDEVRLSAEPPGPPPADTVRQLGDALIRRGADRVTAVVAGRRWRQGPGGALLLGTGPWTAGAAPGRSPQPLPVDLLPEPVYFSADGREVVGLDTQERRTRIDLLGHAVVSTTPGIPIAADAWLSPDGVVHGPSGAWGLGGLEGSCALSGGLLAGPGGRVWSLERGEPVVDTPVIALGLTLATEHGFLTIDWASHRGWTVDPSSGRCTERFALPLSDDDVVSGGVVRDGAAWISTAFGRGFRVRGGHVEDAEVPVPPAPAASALPSPVGLLEVVGTARVGVHTFGWSDDGWLWALPIDQDGSLPS